MQDTGATGRQRGCVVAKLVAETTGLDADQ